MDSAAFAAASTFLNLRNPNPNPNCNRPNRFLLRWPKCTQNPNPSLRNSDPRSLCSSSAASVSATELPHQRLRSLVMEFQSLEEPIDRVKRLLDYAALLPRLADSDRVPGSRVAGCTAEVWLAVGMDGDGRMRFAADSDSEITKGFLSCLIGVLNGAVPEEVLSLSTEDLGALNVGLPGRAQSRVNTWHNVLISMQKRTKAIVTEREEKCPIEPFSIAGCCR